MSNVREFGADGNGLADDAEAVAHALKDGVGSLHFPRGKYRLSRTIEIPLKDKGPFAVTGDDGAATILMEGPGPAFRIIGTHGGTGDPDSWKPSAHQVERMPVVRDLVIEGKHPEADGIELTGTAQGRIEGLLIRKVRDGIRLVKRNRNLLISNCHVYHNTGVGIFLDGVNLHQINICNNHVSYNRRGGIRIEGSEVRNLQITGNDIEYNNAASHPGFAAEPCAEIWIDTTAKGASVNEITVASNTIQATVSAGGANIRILEKPDASRPPGLWAISGNIIGSQENNLHLTGCHGVTLTGNCIYSCGNRNVLVEQCSQVTLSGNQFRRHTPRMHCGVRFVESRDCVISGCIARDETEAGQPTGASLLELVDCERIQVSGSQFLNGVPYGIDVQRGRWISIASCTVRDSRAARKARGSIRFAGKGERNQVSGNLCDVEPDLAGDSGVG